MYICIFIYIFMMVIDGILEREKVIGTEQQVNCCTGRRAFLSCDKSESLTPNVHLQKTATFFVL